MITTDKIQFEKDGLMVLAVQIAPDATNIRVLSNDENYCKAGDLVYKTNQNVWGQGDHLLPEGDWKIHRDVRSLLSTNDMVSADMDPNKRYVVLTSDII